MKYKLNLNNILKNNIEDSKEKNETLAMFSICGSIITFYLIILGLINQLIDPKFEWLLPIIALYIYISIQKNIKYINKKKRKYINKQRK